MWDYFDDIKVDDRRIWRCLLCQEKREFKGNTRNLWSHLAKSKDEKHIEAHNSIKDKCLPPRKKTNTSDNPPPKEREQADTASTSSLNNSSSAATSRTHLCLILCI